MVQLADIHSQHSCHIIIQVIHSIVIIIMTTSHDVTIPPLFFYWTGHFIFRGLKVSFKITVKFFTWL